MQQKGSEQTIYVHARDHFIMQRQKSHERERTNDLRSSAQSFYNAKAEITNIER